MCQKVFLLFSLLLVVQVKSTIIKSPRDLIDEAQAELDDLRSIVHGTILVAHTNLDMYETNFLIDSNNILLAGGLSIQQEHESINERLNTIKALAAAANRDISACTNIREPLLNRLPDEYNGQMRTCIFNTNREEAIMVADSRYIVDVAINKVDILEFQFRQCKELLTCISPLLTEIQLDKIRLPQNIDTEVDATNSLLTTLRLSLQTCSDTNVSQYVADASSLMGDITDCVNNMLG